MNINVENMPRRLWSQRRLIEYVLMKHMTRRLKGEVHLNSFELSTYLDILNMELMYR